MAFSVIFLFACLVLGGNCKWNRINVEPDSNGHVVVPEGTEEVDAYAFWHCTRVKSVSLPSTLTYIGTGAFEQTSLNSVVIPKSVVDMGSHTFAKCTLLTNLAFETYSKLVEIPPSFCRGCQSLITLNVPDSVLTIGQEAFANSGLVTLTVGTDLEGIRDYAFRYCAALIQVTISSQHVTSIGIQAFYGTGKLATFSISDSAQALTIGRSAFQHSGISSISFSNVSTVAPFAFENSKLTSVSLGGDDINIGAYAFDDNANLVEFNATSASVIFGMHALSHCGDLKRVELNAVVMNIGAYCFSGCSSLKNVNFLQSVVSIEEYAFSSCQGLETINLGDLIASIGDQAFERCETLQSLLIGQHAPLIDLPNKFCRYCSSLMNMVIPHNVTTIGAEAFAFSSRLTSVTFGPYLETIGISAFREVPLDLLELPVTLKSIGAHAFRSTKIAKLTIPRAVRDIDSSAFASSTLLKTLTIRAMSDLDIGFDAFYNAPLTSVTLFNNASSIETTTVPMITCDDSACGCAEGYGGTPAVDILGATTCSECKPGSASSVVEWDTCPPCEIGTFQDMERALSCVACAPGKATVNTGATTRAACVDCLPGSYSASGGSACSLCERGFYESGYGSTSCTPCKAGMYGMVVGATNDSVCVQCPLGLYSNVTGAPDATTCQPCPKGFTTLGVGSSSCVQIPTSLPTGQPTIQPTTQPTGQPTTYPTVMEATMSSWSHEAKLSAVDINRGKGLFYVGDHTFTNLGHNYGDYYLSLFVFDSGFGPVKSGSYVQFTINGQDVVQQKNTAQGQGQGQTEKIVCAPVTETKLENVTHGKGCSGTFYPCAFNIPINDAILPAQGGSVTVGIQSYGVLNSACPYVDKTNEEWVIYARYVVSAMPQETPEPTFAPTPVPTESNLNVYKGLQLDINDLDVWALLQISFAAGAALGMFGAFLTNVRKKAEISVYQHPMVYAIVSSALLAAEFTSMVFLLVRLELYGFSVDAAVLGIFRIVQFAVGAIIVTGLFGPVKLREMGGLMSLIDQDHLTSEFRIYMAVAVLCLIDVGYVAFLPWRDSRFAMLSKGYG